MQVDPRTMKLCRSQLWFKRVAENLLKTVQVLLLLMNGDNLLVSGRRSDED
jgi:hypothetical protein